MIKPFAISAALLVLALTLTSLARGETVAADARDDVRRVLQDQQQAWNEGSIERFMAGYWHSADLTFFSGRETRHGWNETLTRYRQKYQGEGKEMGRLTFSEVDVSLAGPDHAWVRGHWQLAMNKHIVSGLFTLIFRKFPEGWRIVHDHTSG
jgi:beta-aspartyl-peptidase (threonine type)